MANDHGWTQEVDEESGRTYLFNSETMDVIFIPTEWSAARSINDDRGSRPQVNINGEAVLTQQSAAAMVGRRREQGQPFSTQVLARMAGTTAGFSVGTVVASVGFGPMVGIAVGAAVAKTVEKAVESGIKWLGRRARRAYDATIRAWYGKAHFNRLQSELRGAYRIYTHHEPHDEAMRLSSSLKAEYCRRFPQWKNGFQ